jgi:hypothetical protein
VTFPIKFAVIFLAEKSPSSLRTTIFKGFDSTVASTDQVVGAEPLKLSPIKYVPRVNVVEAEAVIVISEDPSNGWPFINLEFCNRVAVSELPSKLPLISTVVDIVIPGFIMLNPLTGFELAIVNSVEEQIAITALLIINCITG